MKTFSVPIWVVVEAESAGVAYDTVWRMIEKEPAALDMLASGCGSIAGILLGGVSEVEDGVKKGLR